MESSLQDTPRNAYSPQDESSQIPTSKGAYPINTTSPTPIRSTGEPLGSLVGASLTVVGDAVYVFGGFDQYSDEVFNTLYKLTHVEQEFRWRSVIYTKGRLPSKRNDHSATLWGKNKLVIFGGNSEEEGEYCSDVAVLDLETMTWWHPETHGIKPEGRVRHSATIHDDKLYIAGGITVSSKPSDTLLVLDLISWEWKYVIPFVKRSQHITFMYGDRLYLFGGLKEDMSRSNHLSFIDLEQQVVTHLDIDSPYAPTLAGQRFAQLCGDQLIVVVTRQFTQSITNETLSTGLWSLDLTSMQWKHRDLGTLYDSYNWQSFAMEENETSFYLFGTTEEEPDEYYAMTLCVSLKELGIIPVPPPQLGADLIGLLLLQDEGKRYTDFSIQSSAEPEAGALGVHRLVLMARWPHFAHISDNTTSDSCSNTLTMAEPFIVLKAFVQFLYADNLDQALPLDRVADLMVMARHYFLPRLFALCIRRLHRDMDIEYVSKVYQCAGLAGERGLKQTALQFIFQHFGAVSHTNTFRSLPKDILLEIWDEMPKTAAIVSYGSSDQNRQEDEQAAIKAHELRNKNKAELLKVLDEQKQELASLRVQKVAGGSSAKLQQIGEARKNVARVLTVVNQTQREQLGLFYQKKKFVPLDLRVKKTRAMRRALTPYERRLTTVKQQKKLAYFPRRKYAVKA
ncbi:hypothetical protein DFQ30_001421 [Apophysomyces sp. BC1015]|nr:hypothetical protein DFQ30_001421 [Apophysomyces sp. BC1015]KAG0180928.1 hypothetical protein DFQ29_009867 [Apophysomyces sp. BC1021]